jgi:ABC-2 type transport system permease protein
MAAIFKRDFRAYFTSPLGYVFLAAFLIIINGAFYITSIAQSTNNLSLIHRILLYSMIVLVPILTMRSMSEDYKQKTDQLLLTAPVKASGIVFGKFLAAYAVFVIGLAITFIQVLIVSSVGTPNIPGAIGDYIALLAASAVYIAIGLFVSSLTESQLVAAVASIGIFVAILLLDVFYVFTRVEILKAILYWVSMYRRFNTFYMGVFSLADLVFYISGAGVFLFLTIRILEKKRWS